jgi:hypothetical protein
MGFEFLLKEILGEKGPGKSLRETNEVFTNFLHDKNASE